MNIHFLQFVFVFSFVSVSPALAGAPSDGADDLRLDRYTVQQPQARPEQIDLLSAVVETKIPRSVDTIGSAVDYLLQRSGYRRLSTAATAEPMQLPLPEVHRSIGPLPLRKALETIAGPALELKENAEKRIIWFEKRTQLASESSPLPPEAMQDSESSDSHQSEDQSSAVETWTLAAGISLRENLAEWAAAADWQLEWAFEQDYHIRHTAEFSGSFRQAVTDALEFYRDAPVVLAATFFTGNSVLLIEPALTRSR